MPEYLGSLQLRKRSKVWGVRARRGRSLDHLGSLPALGWELGLGGLEQEARMPGFYPQLSWGLVLPPPLARRRLQTPGPS